MWRPMDSAPKDGTRVLLNLGGVVEIGVWVGHNFMAWCPSPYASPYHQKPSGWLPLPASDEGRQPT